MAEESKRGLKLPEEKEDRISALPDSIIQHILSLLPSTKEAIQTTVLSKTFHNQWTRVPVLKFDSSGMSAKKFSRFVDKTLLLHDCSKIQKFHIQTDCKNRAKGPYWNKKIRLAIGKEVEELFLKFSENFWLPEFVFEHAALVKLHTYNCNFYYMPDNGRVSWGNLKACHLERCLCTQAIQDILRCSPSLEILELSYYMLGKEDIIASKSLKKLVLVNTFNQALQISCPKLEELRIFGQFYVWDVPKLLNWPSLIRVTLDSKNLGSQHIDSMITIMRQLQHVKELEFGSHFIRVLSLLVLGAAPSSVLLNNKSLTLGSPSLEKHYEEIVWTLHSLHVLEKLVINLNKSARTTNLLNLNVSTENDWNSNIAVFNCLESHLKTVEINGLSESDDECKHVLDFIEFILKNARVLEKLVVILKEGGSDFVIQVSQKLFNFPRCSQHAMVELLCSN